MRLYTRDRGHRITHSSELFIHRELTSWWHSDPTTQSLEGRSPRTKCTHDMYVYVWPNI
ncbi:hypothetical protein B0F90DRAFT_1673508 [Multifurca ochricompacta]|uniref:Uncharacterized protein n=1 Tax=Multifurca ochricompacta TaxID=376703 RepID=A0AAD4MC67_9AGAM|nr:hypothetical protein B0F90DRAFT_1673508 [Multifurca ochricompacta]